jgi:hypothetical protein
MAQLLTGRRRRIPAAASVAAAGMLLAALAPATAAQAAPPADRGKAAAPGQAAKADKDVAHGKAAAPGQAAKPDKGKDKPAKGAPAGGCEQRSNNTYDKLLACMTAEGVLEHMEAFQKIADKQHRPGLPRDPCSRDGRLRRQRRVRRRLAARGRYQVTLDPGRDHLQLPRGAAPADACKRRRYRYRCLHRQRVTGEVTEAPSVPSTSTYGRPGVDPEAAKAADFRRHRPGDAGRRTSPLSRPRDLLLRHGKAY